jgi:hypothetical protein
MPRGPTERITATRVTIDFHPLDRVVRGGRFLSTDGVLGAGRPRGPKPLQDPYRAPGCAARCRESQPCSALKRFLGQNQISAARVCVSDLCTYRAVEDFPGVADRRAQRKRMLLQETIRSRARIDDIRSPNSNISVLRSPAGTGSGRINERTSLLYQSLRNSRRSRMASPSSVAARCCNRRSKSPIGR